MFYKIFSVKTDAYYMNYPFNMSICRSGYNVCMCVFALHPILFPFGGGKTPSFTLHTKLTKLILPSNLMEEISPNTEALCANS